MKTEPYTAAEVDAMRFEARRDAIYYVIMTAAAFGTLMAGEPALAALWGFLLLGERLDVLQLLGLSAVIVAGVAAARTGRAVAQCPSCAYS